MRSLVLTLLKVAVAAALVWWVLGRIETQDRLELPAAEAGAEPEVLVGTLRGDWRGHGWSFVAEDGRRVTPAPGAAAPPRPMPGFFTALRALEAGWFALGLLLWTVLLLIAARRWQVLLRAVGVGTGYGEALRLGFIGYFFNNVMLGSTGGDLVRAVMVTRGLEYYRVRAAISVAVDRVIGLLTLMLIAAAVLVALWAAGRMDEVPALRQVARLVLLLLFAAVAAGVLALSRRMRRRLGVDWLLARLPGQGIVGKLDDAVSIYRHRLGTVGAALLMSLPLQVSGVLCFWAMGRALGSPLPLIDNFIVFPVVQTVSAVPIAPAGWGIGESLYGLFFAKFLDGSAWFTLGVAVSVLFRLTTQVGFGLVGGVIWVLSRGRESRAAPREKDA